MGAQSLISRGYRADTIYIKLPMLNVSLLAMASAIITQNEGAQPATGTEQWIREGGERFILILNSLVTHLYNNVYWDLNWTGEGVSFGGCEREKTFIQHILLINLLCQLHLLWHFSRSLDRPFAPHPPSAPFMYGPARSSCSEIVLKSMLRK